MTTHYLNTTKSLRKESSFGFNTYYSYATPVAFERYGKLFVSENVWSRTTGKHLTQIDGGDRKSRIPHDEFVKIYNEARQVL
jgi:hypothetical protein